MPTPTPTPPAGRVEVTRTHLLLDGPEALRASREPAEAVALRRRSPIGADEYLALYTLVGERWHWRDRLAWRTDELEAHLSLASVEIWSAEAGAETAGFFELQRRPEGEVELCYFGLAPAFIGRGIGGWLLTRAAERAFAMGGRRVALNTCTLDGPHALPNYLSRGFAIVREERYEVTL